MTVRSGTGAVNEISEYNTTQATKLDDLDAKKSDVFDATDFMELEKDRQVAIDVIDWGSLSRDANSNSRRPNRLMATKLMDEEPALMMQLEEYCQKGAIRQLYAQINSGVQMSTLVGTGLIPINIPQIGLLRHNELRCHGRAEGLNPEISVTCDITLVGMNFWSRNYSIRTDIACSQKWKPAHNYLALDRPPNEWRSFVQGSKSSLGVGNQVIEGSKRLYWCHVEPSIFTFLKYPVSGESHQYPASTISVAIAFGGVNDASLPSRFDITVILSWIWQAFFPCHRGHSIDLKTDEISEIRHQGHGDLAEPLHVNLFFDAVILTDYGKGGEYVSRMTLRSLFNIFALKFLMSLFNCTLSYRIYPGTEERGDGRCDCDQAREWGIDGWTGCIDAG
ncbi:hypothetical protein C8J56DRAFT_889427 [Mycena floridula]|nr:hypothetical protein C8J56DRAFT_889427 [Mycena floridula]